MKNIVLLGSKGSIGKFFFIRNKFRHNIYSDNDYQIDYLLSGKFIENNNIDFIINCIGSFKNNSLFFHSNFFLPLSIAKALNKNSRRISLIHLSSIGANDPYGQLSTAPFVLNTKERKKLNFNNYELSKCCADFLLKEFLNKNIVTYIIQPSAIVNRNSKLLKKIFLFLIFFPFRLPITSEPPITRIENLIECFENILHDKSKQLIKKDQNTFTIQVIERIPLSKLFPLYKYVLFLKIPINKIVLDKILKILPDIFPFSNFKRIIRFLSFI
jgi:hypothetical protein